VSVQELVRFFKMFLIEVSYANHIYIYSIITPVLMILQKTF